MHGLFAVATVLDLTLSCLFVTLQTTYLKLKVLVLECQLFIVSPQFLIVLIEHSVLFEEDSSFLFCFVELVPHFEELLGQFVQLGMNQLIRPWVLHSEILCYWLLSFSPSTCTHIAVDICVGGISWEILVFGRHWLSLIPICWTLGTNSLLIPIGTNLLVSIEHSLFKFIIQLIISFSEGILRVQQWLLFRLS